MVRFHFNRTDRVENGQIHSKVEAATNMAQWIFLSTFCFLLITAVSSQHINTTDCGLNKGCFRWPTNCMNSRDCLALVTYKVNPATNDSVLIELSGLTNGWVAFGFNDAERKMGGTKGHVCVMRNGSPQLYGFENDGTDAEIRSLVNVTLQSAQSMNGTLICRYERPIVGVAYMRSLTHEWHLVGAWGPGTKDEGSSFELKDHGTGDVFWTRDAHDLRMPVNRKASTYRWEVIFAHAACMILAWVFFSTFGMFFARYTKKDMNKKEVFGGKLWFLMHRILMVLSVLLTIAGVILIFIEVRGWSMEAGAHPYLGVYVTSIALIQPLGGIFRPSIDSPKRKFFEWSHWGSGLIAIILSVVTMYLGLVLLSVPTYVLTIFVAGGAGIILILELLRIGITRKALQVKEDDNTNTLQIEQVKKADQILPKARKIGIFVIMFLAGTITVILIYDVHVKVEPYINLIV